MKPTSNMGQNQKESGERSKKKSWWNKAVVIVIVILIMLIFFVSTRDYEKFKIVNKKTEKLEPWLDAIVIATKECNKIPEIYRDYCYFGIGYATGYNHFENRSEVCPKLSGILSCDRGVGRRAGEEFYNNITLAFELCKEIGIGPSMEICNYHAMRSAARMLAYHNKGLEYCETVDEQYRNACYEGMGWGLGQQYYPMDRERLTSDCNSLGIHTRSCHYGLSTAASEYIAKNPSYIEVYNKRMIQYVQQNRLFGKPLNLSAEFAGFYAGIEHFKDLKIAFAICDNVYKDMDKSLKTICYENVYSGFGYAYYSEQFNKELSSGKKS